MAPRLPTSSLRHGPWEQDICFLIQRAARVVARRFDDGLRPYGLTHGQFILLGHISQSEPSTMTSLASLLAMDRATLTAALKKLERNGFVRISTRLPDRRVRKIAVTRQGRGLLGKTTPVWKHSNVELESLLPEIGLHAFRQKLSSLSMTAFLSSGAL